MPPKQAITLANPPLLNEVTELKPLAAMLKKFRALDDELDRLEKLIPELEEEERSLTASANFSNRTEFDALASLRVKRDLIPGKQAQLLELRTVMVANLTEELSARIQDFNRLVAAATDVARDKVAAVLKPLLGDSPTFERQLEQAAVLKPFYEILYRFSPTYSYTGGPALVAEQLFETWKEFLTHPPTLPASVKEITTPSLAINQ